jgi:hypothetical protein
MGKKEYNPQPPSIKNKPLPHPAPSKKENNNETGNKKYLTINNIEGIVWYRFDSKMVKTKGIDFEIKRK